MKNVTITICLMALLVTGCANSQMNKGQQGALGGAAGGALLGQAIGQNTEATLIGAGVGLMLGYIVGNEMDKWDRQNLNQTYENVASGRSVQWKNPDTGNQYQVTPTSTTGTPQRPCRDAEIQAVIDGRQETTYTTACRNDRGEWELQ
jgi:surface antigen